MIENSAFEHTKRQRLGFLQKFRKTYLQYEYFQEYGVIILSFLFHIISYFFNLPNFQVQVNLLIKNNEIIKTLINILISH